MISLPISLRIFFEKVLGQGPEVALSLPEGRHLDFDDIEAVKEIFAELAGDHLLFQAACWWPK